MHGCGWVIVGPFWLVDFNVLMHVEALIGCINVIQFINSDVERFGEDL